MLFNSRNTLIAAMAWIALQAGPALSLDLPPVDGLLGLETADGSGWMAIKVDFDESSALAGVMWYNNDSSVAFPALLVGTGLTDGPDVIGGFVPVAGATTGQSDGWSECTFTQPVAASLGGLYVAFEFPAGAGFTSRGIGGGPAIGFAAGLTEPHGWISGDGETWYPLAGDFGLAVAPMLVPFDAGMLVKSLAGDTEAPDIPGAYYTNAGPNPFNPQVVVRYGLPHAGKTRIDVFDVRGRRVARLLDRMMPAGHHEVVWRGRDAADRRLPSGPYFIRITSGSLAAIERVTMVK